MAKLKSQRQKSNSECPYGLGIEGHPDGWESTTNPMVILKAVHERFLQIHNPSNHVQWVAQDIISACKYAYDSKQNANNSTIRVSKQWMRNTKDLPGVEPDRSNQLKQEGGVLVDDEVPTNTKVVN